MPATIEDGMASQAAEFVDAWRGDGAPIDADKLDYTRESLALVDEVLQNFHERQVELPEDLHFLASAYVFETARRQYGGRYLRGDGVDQFVLVMGEPDCQVGWCAMSKVKGRADNGPEDDLTFFYDGIAGPLERKTDATLI